MVYTIGQPLNVHNSATYTPQSSSALLNVYPWVSSAYHTSCSNSPHGDTEGMYYPAKLPLQSTNAGASLNSYDNVGECNPSPLTSSYHPLLHDRFSTNSFRSPMVKPPAPSISPSSEHSSSPKSPHHYQNQDHIIHEIQVSQNVISMYVSCPTIEELRTGWRPDYLKCNYPDCASRAIDPSRLHSHLALHLNSKKAYGCSCGTTFGRLSEANRHKNDQSPCEICGDSRRKQKGTNTCSRCYTGSAMPVPFHR